MCNDDESEHTELWLHGTSDEDLDRQCPNCGAAVDLERLRPPEETDELLLCPECGAELPWRSIEEIPQNDWFNWACLEKEDYTERSCFDEPVQKALSLAVSLADPRGADVGLEITRTSTGDVLVKVDNRENFTYYKYAGTTIEGSYTVVRFSHP